MITCQEQSTICVVLYKFLYISIFFSTRETLASGNLLSVINILMQLRKVCNHPNLFEVRPTTSPFLSDGITLLVPSLVFSALEYDVWKVIFKFYLIFSVFSLKKLLKMMI